MHNLRKTFLCIPSYPRRRHHPLLRRMSEVMEVADRVLHVLGHGDPMTPQEIAAYVWADWPVPPEKLMKRVADERTDTVRRHLAILHHRGLVEAETRGEEIRWRAV